MDLGSQLATPIDGILLFGEVAVFFHKANQAPSMLWALVSEAPSRLGLQQEPEHMVLDGVLVAEKEDKPLNVRLQTNLETSSTQIGGC